MPWSWPRKEHTHEHELKLINHCSNCDSAGVVLSYAATPAEMESKCSVGGRLAAKCSQCGGTGRVLTVSGQAVRAVMRLVLAQEKEAP